MMHRNFGLRPKPTQDEQEHAALAFGGLTTLPFFMIAGVLFWWGAA